MIRKKKVIITLVGVGQARIGLRFIHKGGTPKCRSCQYRKVCIENLEPNRIYEIVGLRKKVLFCEAYEINMKVVEVLEADLDAAVNAKLAIEGAVVSFENPECDKIDCKYYNLCFPQGLKRGDRVKVIKVFGNLLCPQKFLLKKTRLQRIPSGTLQ